MASDYNTSKYTVHNLNVIRRNLTSHLFLSVLLGVAYSSLIFFLSSIVYKSVLKAISTTKDLHVRFTTGKAVDSSWSLNIPVLTNINTTHYATGIITSTVTWHCFGRLYILLSVWFDISMQDSRLGGVVLREYPLFHSIPFLSTLLHRFFAFRA